MKVLTIGEALIDLMGDENGRFVPSPGGAPANVAACISRLGGHANLLTKLSCDFFGDYLLEQMSLAKIDCSTVVRTNEGKTGMAVVTHNKYGERSFTFYRESSADLLLDENEIEPSWFVEPHILHFCSVSLVEAPIKKAHQKAIELSKSKGGLVCFDPNIRVSLWDDLDAYKTTINEFIQYADILKISDEELQFITGIEDEKEAIESLLKKVKVVIYTMGGNGACIFTPNYVVTHPGVETSVVDTTGAGDSFIGAFLYQLAHHKVDNCLDIKLEQMEEFLSFANTVASYVVSKKGTITIMPTIEEIKAS